MTESIIFRFLDRVITPSVLSEESKMMEKGLVVALELLLDTLSPELFMGSLLMGHLVKTHKKVLFLETEQSNIEQYTG